MYAADFLKTKLGSFTLTKLRTREEVIKMSDTDAKIREILERSSDSGLGAYKSEKDQPVLIWVFSFPTPDQAASTFEEFAKDMRGSYRWRNVKSSTIEHGKRIEGTDSKSRATIIWTNGYWLFWVWSGDPALSTSFAESVGY
jgi:hypothetical protein